VQLDIPQSRPPRHHRRADRRHEPRPHRTRARRGILSPEHYSLDFPLPSFGERFDAVEEQLELITGLWTAPPGQLYTYHGKKYRIQDYPALVRPVQIPHPPIIIGGHGLKRTPALAARYANEYNIDGVEPAACTQAYDRVRQACERIDRDPTDITFSAAVTLCLGASKADIERRIAVLHDRVGEDPTTIIANGLCGSPAEVIDKLSRFEDGGAERVYLQLFDLTDLDQLQLFADEVLPHFADREI
jgi:alkanesulfonate monooxygenase SsuD/methylene tetrahydromethanopterin reductase-like flavin-dependent oxidoreductase (luciferase family)